MDQPTTLGSLTRLLRSLGAAGAVANVRKVLDQRQQEDWVVEGLSRRLEPSPAPARRAA
jgi:hypothetical protein